MKYNIGDVVDYNGRQCIIKFFSGVMQTTYGTVNKYDILDIAGDFVIPNVSETELK